MATSDITIFPLQLDVAVLSLPKEFEVKRFGMLLFLSSLLANPSITATLTPSAS